jgi:hypothetical protein
MGFRYAKCGVTAPLLLGLLFRSPTAIAQTGAPLPAYDIAAYCEMISKTNGGSYWLEKACRDQEQTALATLREAPIEVRIMRNCQTMTEAANMRSYWFLNACIQQEIAAKKALSR